MLASVHRWILTHDDSKAFVIVYIGLAVVLAIFLGLFWLALVVAVHFAIEMIKQHHYDSRLVPVLTRSLWELKLDIGLVVCGIVIGLYIDVLFGLVGLGHVARAGAQTAARAGMWPRVIRGVLLTVDDVALVAKGLALKGKKGADAENLEAEASAESAVAMAATGTDSPAPASTIEAPAAEAEMPGGSEEPAASERPTGGQRLWGGWLAPRWGLGDKIALGFTSISIALIFVAPLLTEHSFTEVWEKIIFEELHPFPPEDEVVAEIIVDSFVLPPDTSE